MRVTNVQTLRVRVWSGARIATGIVNRARQKGLIDSPCEFLCVDCGKQASVYDHRDYGCPLSIEPTCHSRNTKRGSAKAKVWDIDEAIGYARQRIVKECVGQFASFQRRHENNDFFVSWVRNKKRALADWEASGRIYGLVDVAFDIFPKEDIEAFQASENLESKFAWMRF